MTTRRRVGRHHSSFLSLYASCRARRCLSNTPIDKKFGGDEEGSGRSLLFLTQRYCEGWSICHHSSLVQLQPMAWEKCQKQEGGYHSEWWCMNFASLVTVHTWDKFRRMLGHWGFPASHPEGKAAKYVSHVKTGEHMRGRGQEITKRGFKAEQRALKIGHLKCCGLCSVLF